MAGGLFAHRLKFAHVGGLAVAFAACLGVRAKGWPKWLAFGTVAAGAASIVLFTYARAAVIGLAVALPVALFLSMRWTRWSRAGVVLACAAVLTAAGLNSALRQRFISALTTDGSGDRAAILASGARAVREHPLAGVGLGRFRPSLYAAPDVPQYVLDNPGKAHNQLLSTAAETGLPGAALFLLLALWLVLSLSREHPAGAAGLSSLAFFAVLSLFHDPLYQAPFSMGLSLALGAAMGLGRVTAPAPARTPLAS
jgi:O-antigen ligase